MSRMHQHERGVALVLVIMSLLLLSAIGIGMLLSADTETAIAMNYRDKQAALYGAESGLQEARDLVRTSSFFADLPADKPGPGALNNIVYILNPAAGETIDPWRAPTSSNPNPYYDTDICTKLPAICTSNKPPSSGYSWISPTGSSPSMSPAVDTSVYAAAGKLSFKWARLMLKTDNMTPVPVIDTVHGATSTTGAQVCYDSAAHSQFPRTAGYSVKCIPPTGQVASVKLALGNTGGVYNSPPTVTLSAPPSGTTATATATVVNDTGNEHLTSITVTAPGSNYTAPPTVTIDPPPLGGTQATAIATIVKAGAPVNGATLTSAGTPAGCYASNISPAISATGGGGSGATFTATMSAKTCIVSWTASGSCKSKKGQSGVAATGSGGFTGTIDFSNGSGNVSGTTVTNPGSGITTPPSSVSISGCTAITPTFTLGYQVSSVALNQGGTGYTSAPALSFAPPSVGGTPTGTATLGSSVANAGQVLSITVTSPGSGYTTTPNVTLTTSDGNLTSGGATASASVSPAKKITGFTVTNPGSGYRAAPTVTISGGGGSGAQAVATLSNQQIHYGQVYLLTSMARASAGSVAMQEMEVATSYYNYAFQISGALTLAGPSPTFNPPHSANMVISGRDSPSCSEPAFGNKPALAVYDDPSHPTNPTSVQAVTNAVNGAKPENFVGVKATADVQNVYSQIGPADSAAAGLESFVQSIYDMPGVNVYPGGASNIYMGTPTAMAVDIVEGDYSGGGSGYGILVVRGNLTMSGNFSWHGLILVIGTGNAVFNGGGNGQITGAIYVANTHGGSGTLSAPDATWNGGGGNGIQYDHCWADNLINQVPFTPQLASVPLKVLSSRLLGN